MFVLYGCGRRLFVIKMVYFDVLHIAMWSEELNNCDLVLLFNKKKDYKTGISSSVVTVSGCARYNDFMIRELFTSVSFVPFLVVSTTKFFMVHNCFLRLLVHLRECALSCVGIILSFLVTSVAF